jgi:hypothetical protein
MGMNGCGWVRTGVYVVWHVVVEVVVDEVAPAAHARVWTCFTGTFQWDGPSLYISDCCYGIQ